MSLVYCLHPTKMRVAFGVDGVLADVEAGLSELADKVFQPRPDTLSPVQQRLLWRVVLASENFWEQLAETEPGAVARLAAIARERGWEVIFLVRRVPTAGSTPQLQTQNWLVAHGFELPSVFIVDRPLADIERALQLDAIVDSPYEHVWELADRAPASGTAKQRSAVRDVTRIGSIDEVARRLCELDELSAIPVKKSEWKSLLGFGHPKPSPVPSNAGA